MSAEDELPPDPWLSGDLGADVVEQGSQLFEALVEQQTVADLFRALSALDDSELFAVVLARVLWEMAERRR